MTPLALTVPETNESGLAAVARANALTITNNDEYLAADQFAVGLKALEKEVDLGYDEHITAAFQAHKSLVAKKKKYAEPIEEARKIVKGKMIAWATEQEVIRQAEETRLRAEAQKSAETEALARAAAMESAGQSEEAQAIISEPVVAAPVRLAASVPKASTTTRTVWDYEITDKSKIPADYLMVDNVKLGGVVRATKGAINIPGVRVFSRKV